MIRQLAATLFLALTAFSAFAEAKRTCFTSLRLKTNSGFIDRDIPDFKVRSFLGTCGKIKKDCPGKVLEHVKNNFGPNVNPMTGDSSVKMCELFGREILPSDNPDVDVKYKASSCGTEGYMSIGSLCCFKCRAGPYTFYHPINHCAPTKRPAWCQ